jgi:hypothetical protein
MNAMQYDCYAKNAFRNTGVLQLAPQYPITTAP